MLYQKAILALASQAYGAGRLKHPDATADMRNPLCGDRVILDIIAKDGKIRALGHDVKACVVCQASASLVGRHALGATLADMQKLQGAIERTLKGQASSPGGKWRDYATLLEGVAPYGNRHECVLLPLRATIDALERIAETQDDEENRASG